MKLDQFLKKASEKSIISFGETLHGQHTFFFKELTKYINQFEGIFIEKPVNDQRSIDYYVRNGRFDSRMCDFIKGAKGEGKDIKETIKAILDYGRINGKKLLAIDSSKEQDRDYNKISNHGHYFLKGESRDGDMYGNILDNYVKNQRWLLICGAAHLEEGKHYGTNKYTLGQLLSNKFKNKLLRVVLVTDKDYSKKVNSVRCYFADKNLVKDSYLSQFNAWIVVPADVI